MSVLHKGCVSQESSEQEKQGNGLDQVKSFLPDSFP